MIMKIILIKDNLVEISTLITSDEIPETSINMLVNDEEKNLKKRNKFINVKEQLIFTFTEDSSDANL